ncbi:MAG: acyl-CoA dehydrogenase family protein, partial [Thermodesulfobacteriota bacterium]|nr:acyl-CoA dehydrogenase family protein [Thermodesulfobacteriota bacterium]
ALNEIAPLVEKAEETGTFPLELYPKMGAQGYLCVTYDEKYGGAGADKVCDAIINLEIGRISMAFSATLSSQMLSTFPILVFGNNEQKEKYFPVAISGEKTFAFGMTEPNAGSDSAGIEMTAKRDGNSYVLNGTKMFVTNGPFADYITISASTDRSKGIKGIAVFIVHKDAPGLKNMGKLEKMGLHSAETGEIVFEDCRVPGECLVGPLEGGFPALMEALNESRISVAAMIAGTAQAAHEAALSYSKERVAFGRPISKFQVNRFKLVDMGVMVEISQLLVYRAAWLCDQKRPFGKEASMAKLYASEAASFVTGEAVQLHGGYGYMREYPVERYFRDARAGTIFEGTSEIQHEIIARSMGI